MNNCVARDRDGKSFKERVELPQNVTRQLETCIRQNGYCLAEYLGSGVYSAVYRAVNPKGENVALKIEKRVMRKEDMIPNILLHTLRCYPGIVCFHDLIMCNIGKEEYTILVSEFVSGRTFYDLVQERKITEGDLMIISGILVRAVEYAHNLKIYHNDLHMNNIMVSQDKDGNWRVPTIVDWGLASFHHPQGDRDDQEWLMEAIQYARKMIMYGKATNFEEKVAQKKTKVVAQKKAAKKKAVAVKKRVVAQKKAAKKKAVAGKKKGKK